MMTFRFRTSGFFVIVRQPHFLIFYREEINIIKTNSEKVHADNNKSTHEKRTTQQVNNTSVDSSFPQLKHKVSYSIKIHMKFELRDPIFDEGYEQN